MGEHTAIGSKVCIGCGQLLLLTEFSTKGAGRLHPRCRACARIAHAAKTAGRVPRPMGPPPNPPRAGDREQARQRVNVLVRTGRMTHPNDIPCADCGHAHVAGERRHEYDHFKGYAPEHHLSVESVCTTCHAARARARGEVVQVRGASERFVRAKGDSGNG